MSDLIPPPLADAVNLHAPVLLQQAILDVLPIRLGVYEVVSRMDFRLTFLNRAALQAPGATTDVIGKLIDEFLPPVTAIQVRQRFQHCMDTGETQTIEDSYQLPNGLLWAVSSFVPMRDPDGRVTHILNVWEDITARKQREQEERERQAEIIEQQAATLEELSTPLLAISETTVVMPLVGTIDSRRVQQLMSILLSGVSAMRATKVILDITGVPIVDTQVANAFLHASQAVSLLGSQVIITGIRPEVAQTLVGLGVDLLGIVTRSTLRDGITYALRS